MEKRAIILSRGDETAERNAFRRQRTRFFPWSGRLMGLSGQELQVDADPPRPPPEPDGASIV